MNREEVIATLKAHQPELMAMGILHAGLFGSVARDEQTPASDIDIMIELDPEKKMGVFEYAGIKLHIADLFKKEVDVVNRKALRPALQHSVYEDFLGAF